MFYFQQLLNIAMSGIDATSIIPTMTGIAYGILLVGFLVAVYQAVMRGGDVQALGVAAIKYIIVAIIIANWGTVFREVNTSFNSIAQAISNSSGAGDMFQSWLDQLRQQITSNDISLWDVITGDIAALIGVLLIAVAYIVYVVSLVLFCFFYALYGSVLYVLGPPILALLPIGGVGQLAKSFATNIFIWNAWGVLYATLGALITAVQFNQVSQVGGGGFLGFLRGPVDTLILGLISIFFALAIAVIPFIAKRIISGDVGASAMTLVSAALTAGGIAIAGIEGFAAGASGASGGGGGASGGGASEGSSSGGAGGPSGGGAASSSSAPPTPSTAGESIRSGLVSAAGSDSGPSAPLAQSEESSNHESGENAPASSRSGSQTGVKYRPQGVAQSFMYRAGHAIGNRVGKNEES